MLSLDRRSFLSGFAAALAPALSAQSKPAPAAESKNEALARAVAQRLAGFAGQVFLYARNLDTGAEFGLQPDERVRTASTIKLPVLCALFDLAAQGKVHWDEKLTLRDEDKVTGSGVLHELSAGVQLSLRDLSHLMIVVSDNTATNLILDRITCDAVNAYLEKIGMRVTRSLRQIRGDAKQLKPAAGFSKAGLLAENQRYGIGVSTPREMAWLLEQLVLGRIVSADASKEILAILKRQQFKDGIGRRRADDVASKSGALDALRSDVGIVSMPHARIAIAATVDAMPKVDYSPDNAGNILIADLTDVLLAGLA
ncbi:MAG: serine hydrolase [Bryobacteraceae bacterium]